MKKPFISLIIISILTGVLTGCGSKQASEGTQQTQTKAEIEAGINDIAVKLVTDLSKGEYEKAFTGYRYHAKMLKVINAKFLEEKLWKVLESNYGPFQEITGFSASQSQGYDIIAVKTTFEKAKLNINIVFDTDKLIAGINFTPDTTVASNSPPDSLPDSVIESSVTFGKSGWELPGTLTLPKKEGKYPVVVLVHGSGPNDRDETIGPNKPFRDIAWGLAEKGIACLRYDKRTFVYGSKIAGDLTNLTVFGETVEDAGLAVQFLKTQDKINSSRIYVLGHSLGGMLIPRIAQITPDASGYIIMSGLVTPMEDIMVEQVKYIGELDGSLSAEEKSTIASYEKMRDNVKRLDQNTGFTPSELFGIPASYWLDLKGYQPAVMAKEITKPLLVLQGERDYQVPVKEFDMWKSALDGSKNATFILYPGLNHLMIKGEGKSSPQEYTIPGKVDSKVIGDIASWIK